MSGIEDPCQQSKVLHMPDEAPVPCLCGLVSGCESVTRIAGYGNWKLDFLHQPSNLTHSTPSDGILSVMLRMLDPVLLLRKLILYL